MRNYSMLVLSVIALALPAHAADQIQFMRDVHMNGQGITNANYIEFGGKGILAKGDSIHFGGNLVVDGGSLDMNGGAITKAVIPPSSLANAAKTSAFGINIENAGVAITAGSKGFVTVPYDCMITNWTLLADQSGSIVIDVKRSTYDAFPPTASIAGSAKPTLSSVQKNQDYLLTGWTKDLAAGDVIEFVVDSAATVTRVNLSISVVKK